ncbi:MAG TPA: asparagine synthase-related protein [Thermoanaerobaculia bacterium]
MRLDGAPIDRARLEALAKPAPGALVDDSSFWQDESIGLAYALARVNPESVNERQPLVDRSSGCVIIFDGRLDNRPELRAALSGDDGVLGEQPDVAYALAAYLRWGTSSPEHLLGDFALAIWDPRSRQLLLANDPIAVRPIYFSRFGDHLTFASTLEQMLNDPLQPRDIDEGSVLRYLFPQEDATPTTQTHYRKIQLMPGGHQLYVSQSGVQLHRYWNWPEHPPEPRQRSEADVEEFRALFAEAVRCRLRSTMPVGLTLSGGLDSGSIASMAGYLCKQGDWPAIRAYSFVFDDYSTCDERVYSQAAAARYGFAHTCVPADDCWSLSRFEDWRPVFTEPHFGAYEDAWYKVLSRAREDGVRAMMTGDGGDFVVGGSPYYLSDWLLQGRWRAFYGEVRARVSRPGQSALRGVVPAVFGLLPRSLQGRLSRHGLAHLDTWIPPRLRPRHRAHTPAPLHQGQYAWWYQFRDLLNHFTYGYHNAFKDRQMRRFGLEVRQPFFDVRLIQFSLRMPPDVFYRNDTTKVVMREALRDILPPVIRDRRDKTNLGPLAQVGLRERRPAFVEALLEDSELQRRDYVVPDAWKRDMREYMQKGGPPYWAVWRSLTTEMWLRHLAGRLPPLQ